MKAAKTWCLAGLVLVAGLSSASCGKDEGTGGGGGNGTVINDGGTAGKNGGRAGGGGTGGSGGGTSAPATKLGRACVADSECVDATAPGLTCVTSKDAVLGNGAPPKGLCTATCTKNGDCSTLGDGALCFQFSTSATSGYCVEACKFGKPDIGQTKCHSRPEFACNPAALLDTMAPCTKTTDCQSGELCVQGTCNTVVPACLPACRGDIDCEAGMYCDQAFLSGVCVTKPQTGKALGQPCTVPAANQPDECLGFCQADAANSTKGHCAASCSLGGACAWDPATKKFDGACLNLSVVTGQNGSLGDFGFCTLTCNCAAECMDATLACDIATGALPAQFRGSGLCSPPTAPMFQAYNQCTGAGGASSGVAGAPAGGAP
jgi:hypothetical protein